MPSSQCRVFFEAHAGDLRKVEALQQIAERFTFEKDSASKHSPGVVAVEEICRQIQQPLYFNPVTGTPTPDAYNDAFNKGLSTDRMSFTSEDDVVERGRARDRAHNEANPEKPPRKLVALAFWSTNDIRSHQALSGDQGLGVFDTATADNAAHADVCSLISGKQEKRRAREHLEKTVRIKLLPNDPAKV